MCPLLAHYLECLAVLLHKGNALVVVEACDVASGDVVGGVRHGRIEGDGGGCYGADSTCGFHSCYGDVHYLPCGPAMS